MPIDFIYKHFIRFFLMRQEVSNVLDKKIMGERLRMSREARNISRKELAELLNVTRTQVSDIENGKSGTNLDRFLQLCKLYQVSADYLLGITDDPAWRGGQEEGTD